MNDEYDFSTAIRGAQRVQTSSSTEKKKVNKKNFLLEHDKRFLDTTSAVSDNEFASVAWYVTVDRSTYHKNDELAVTIDASLRITDCYKIVTLDFSGDSLELLDSRIDKIKNLESALKEQRAALIKARGILKDAIKSPSKYLED